jgi:hypothetical protein
MVLLVRYLAPIAPQLEAPSPPVDYDASVFYGYTVQPQDLQ